MLTIPCPWCGPRDEREFVHGGDASVDPSALAAADTGAMTDALYFRDNPRGPYREWWFHAAGCGRWLAVTRNTLTHEILAADQPGEPDR